MRLVSYLSAFAVYVCTSALSVADHPTDKLGQQLGTIHFDVSGNDAARGHVVRGVKLMHHMMYLEADREFAAAVAADSDCALAYWGRAMTMIRPLWPDSPTPAELKQGLEFVRTGLARNPKTARERDYLQALERYYDQTPAAGYPAGLKMLDAGWAEVASKYPKDLDAAAFSALFHLAPARFMAKDKSHRIQLEAAQTIQQVLAQIPDHPGAQHYKIHAFDFPMLADRALEICETYGAIAPDVPHALHMPTHIYTRRGLWEKSIDFNRRSADAARKINEKAGEVILHYPHALDYLVYAYLQRGQYRAADAIRQEVLGMPGPYHAANRSGIAFAFAAIPARYTLERHDWAGASQLKLHQPASFPWSATALHCDSIIHFARAIGAIRTGNLDMGRSEIQQLEELHRKISAAYSVSYWISQAETQLLAARGWLKLKEGDAENALALMRRATELETKADKEAVTPGEVLPAGELLGDMLADLKRPADALAAFQAVLVSSPNRLNSLYGAARSAEAAGDIKKATHYYRDYTKLVEAADPDARGSKDAKAFLARAVSSRSE